MPLNNIERLSQYAVLVIALSALFVSIWQMNLMQKHNELTVQPFMDFHIESTDSTKSATFSNEGLGPAIIKQIEYSFDGNTFASLGEVLQAAGELENTIARYNYGENTVVANGDSKLLITLKGSKFRGIEVVITYSSVYGEEKKMVLNL